MATHSSTLAWKFSWMEKPGRLQSMGSGRVRHDWATSLWLFTFMHWRRKWQPTPVFLPGESQGGGEPGGLPSMGPHRVRHDWCNSAAAAAVAVCIGFNLSMPHHLSPLVALSLFSMSVSLFLFHKWVCLYHWLNSIYKQYHIYISPSDWLSMIISRSIHVA